MDVRRLSEFTGFSEQKLQKHNVFQSERFFLDVYCLRPGSFWALLALFPALRLGRLRHRESVHVMRGRTIEVRTRRTLPVNTDGDLTTRTPAEFRVARGALEVVVPASYQSNARTEDHAAAE